MTTGALPRDGLTPHPPGAGPTPLQRHLGRGPLRGRLPLVGPAFPFALVPL